ncbi:hypothetical protein SLS62_009407 [Diatrype stigma]|uniref:Uncharacterized protein n=1 Tax=Diatrype stigma TaxID=117547 RepID=A0AAN9UE31_9PEZI
MTLAPPVLLLAGYSYGATITTKLPPLDEILSHFASPVIHTAAADIRLRAQHLAEQQNRLSNTPLSPRKSLGVRIGGDENVAPTSPRRPRSRSYAREEKIRKGVKDILSQTRIIHRKHRRKHPDHGGEVEHVEQCMEKTESFMDFRSAYLFVSPPLGILTNLITMSFPSPFSSWPPRGAHSKTRNAHHVQEDHHDSGESEEQRDALGDDQKFVTNPTLAIYGDQDAFLALKKMREWAAHLSTAKDSSFRYVEVSGAGHFWVEERVIFHLRDAIGNFSLGILDNL